MNQLYPFQYEGVQFLSQNPNSLLSDEVGLGKTIQSIATAIELNCKKVLVVCPASVKYQWSREIERFTNKKSEVISGKIRFLQYKQSNAMFFITNYELVLKDFTYLRSLPWDMVIADEITRIKNYRSKTKIALLQIPSKYRLGLTATPLENNLRELHSIISWVRPNFLGMWKDFFNQYCYYRLNYWGGYEITGVKNPEQLREQLSKVMIRRRKSEVLPQLPPIIRQEYYVPLSPDQKKMYETLEQDIRNSLTKPIWDETDKISVLTKLLYLREVCNSPRLINPVLKENGKVDEIFEIAFQHIEEGHKVVIFSQWTKFIDLLKEVFPSPMRVEITGEVSQSQRDVNIQVLNNNPEIKVCLCSDAGNYGVNLQSADVLIHADLLWNPQKMYQREGRIHRIGQKNPVNIITIMTENTIEQRVFNLLQKKQDLFNEVIEGQQVKINRETLEELWT